MLTAGLFLLGIGEQALAQPEPWLHPDGSIHYYSAVAAPAGITWSDASDSAQRHGGYLATLTSQAENGFVFELANLWSCWYCRPGSNDWAGPWLGGKQESGSPEPDSGWRWVSGEALGFANWSTGQPNNQGDQDALHFGESPCGWLSTWNDLSGTDTAIRGFVLELSAESTTIGLLQNGSAASIGYSLFQPNHASFIFLVDNKGRYVHSWYSPYQPAWSNYLLEDGSLLHTGCLGNTHFQVGGAGGRVSRIDWDGDLLWAYEYSNDVHCQHHDIEPLPNGNFLLIAWEKKSRSEAIAAGRDPSKLWADEFWPDHIIEVRPADSSIVWEWHVWDHLIQDFDSTKANYGVVADHSELVDINYMRTYDADWMHCNSVDYNPQFDQILLSVRELGEVWILDHSTTTEQARGHSGGRYGMGGDILYRWGNPQAYRAGGADDRKFYAQHDVRWVEPDLPGAGRITVFNNGVGRPGGDYSTVDEFTPVCDSTGRYSRPAPETPFGPAALCWTYGGTPPSRIYSLFMGGAHRLPNGNTLICESDSGLFFEVTPDKQVVWRYVNPVTDSIRLFQGDVVPNCTWARMNSAFRVTRYAPDYPGLAGRDLTPGYPLERYTPLVVGMEEPPWRPARVPTAFSVRPNPAKAGTDIRLQIADYCLTQVSVFDAAGRCVRALNAPRNVSSVTWDGTDSRGRRLSAAVYFIRLESPAGPATRQLVLQ